VPELPEVETVRRGLSELIVGRRVLAVEALNDKSFEYVGASDEDLIGAKVTEIRRRGKVLIIDLSSGCSLVGHLKMTGQMVFRGGSDWAAGHPTDSFVGELPDRSTRVMFELSARPKEANFSGAKLFFNDQRKFGWIKLMPTAQVEDLPFLQKMGPEPFWETAESEFLRNIRRHPRSLVKAAILDQTVMAGIGNIYADESLWAAKVHPATRVGDLSDRQLRQIFQAARAVMTKSIESGGSTMKNYIRADGTRGDYLEKFANVFRREGQACRRCGTTIEKIRVAGRGTHICPKCQHPPTAKA
jgi:formamidopyrimidine-DNA glycosylase